RATARSANTARGALLVRLVVMLRIAVEPAARCPVLGLLADAGPLLGAPLEGRLEDVAVAHLVAVGALVVLDLELAQPRVEVGVVVFQTAERRVVLARLALLAAALLSVAVVADEVGAGGDEVATRMRDLAGLGPLLERGQLGIDRLAQLLHVPD